MQNPFELKGYWWLPGLEGSKLSGTLTYSQEDGATLELEGMFDSDKSNPEQNVPIMLGITQQGKPITLYKCIISSWAYPLNGLGRGKYRALFIFEGVHFKAEENIKFSQLFGGYTDLDAWVDVYGFTIEMADADNKLVSNVRYEQPTSQLFDIGENYEVGIDFSSRGPNYSIIQTEVTISQCANLVVKSKNGDSQFDDLFKQLNIFTYLLQFAIQRIPFCVSLSGFSEENVQEYAEGKTYHPEISIFYTPIEPIVNQKQRIPQEFLFTLKDLSDDQISTWFKSFDQYETIIHLYRSLFYNNRLFIDTKFLAIAQALESLHSSLFGGQYLPNDQFVRQKERVLNTVPPDLTEWVEAALSNANYKRFRQKIFELLKNKSEIVRRFVDDMELLAERVTHTRNEFVHLSKHKKTFKIEELPSEINKLTIVLELYLLEIMGFSNEKVKELIEPKIQTQRTGWKHLRTFKK